MEWGGTKKKKNEKCKQKTFFKWQERKKKPSPGFEPPTLNSGDLCINCLAIVS